jgi:hypothetical protein
LRRRLARLRYGVRTSAADSAELPQRLRRRLEAEADSWIRTGNCSGEAQRPHHAAHSHASTPTHTRASTSGWYAAAACLLLAVVGWWPRIESAGHGLTHGISPLEPAAERARLQLIAHDGSQLGRWPWQAESGLPAGVEGEVVWSGTRQQGYLTLTGLEANDPRLQQYQLWIVDASRDERYPVDGGVFDVPAGARHVTVPVHPAVQVAEPIMFVVTRERAGGVVVSDRSQLVALARTGLH